MNPVVHCQIKRINGALGDHSILRCLVGLPHPPSVTKSHSGSSLTKTARGLIHKQTTKWTWMETCATSVPSLDLEFQFKQLYIDHFPRGRGSIHLIHPLGSMTSQMWNTRRQLKHFAFYTLKNCFRSWVLIARLNLLHTRFRKKSKITKTNTSWQFYVDMALKHKLLIKCTPAATNLKAKWKAILHPERKRADNNNDTKKKNWILPIAIYNKNKFFLYFQIFNMKKHISFQLFINTSKSTNTFRNPGKFQILKNVSW